MRYVKGIFSLLLAIGAAAVLWPLAAQEPIRHDFEGDLRARHPEIATDASFQKWRDGNPVGPWHEAPVDAERRTVVVQNAPGDSLFAALVVLAPIGAELAARPAASVQRTATMNLRSMDQTRAQVMKGAATKWSISELRATRPVVDFLPDGKVNFGWEFEVNVDSRVETYRLQGSTLEFKSRRQFPQQPQQQRPNPSARGASILGSNAAAAPFLATDDLHDPSAFAAEAATWTRNLATVRDKARRINEQVYRNYFYDPYITHIVQFTWSDFLTAGQNARRGVCDELTVVAVSYLRALSIPARIKLFAWKDANGKRAAHAAVEYEDGGAWHHMDPTWNTFDDPASYRTIGRATDITVMDADYPLDARSNGSAFGVPDVNGDRKLHPYEDFKLQPAHPGNTRPGYSH